MVPADPADEPSLSERVVKEAVERGLETSFREPILEAVDESDAGSSRRRRIPLAGLLLGTGAAVGYALARSATLQEAVEEAASETPTEPEPEPLTDDGADANGRRLRGILGKLAIAAGVVGVGAVLYRRFSGSGEPEWEPIEEFEPDREAGEELAGPGGTTDVGEEDLESAEE